MGSGMLDEGPLVHIKAVTIKCIQDIYSELLGNKICWEIFTDGMGVVGAD